MEVSKLEMLNYYYKCHLNLSFNKVKLFKKIQSLADQVDSWKTRGSS